MLIRFLHIFIDGIMYLYKTGYNSVGRLEKNGSCVSPGKERVGNKT
jgi:hypothetical protein